MAESEASRASDKKHMVRARLPSLHRLVGIHVPVASVRSRDMSLSVCERGSCIIAEMLNTNLVIHWSQTRCEL